MKFFFSIITSVLLIIGMAPSAFAAKADGANPIISKTEVINEKKNFISCNL